MLGEAGGRPLQTTGVGLFGGACLFLKTSAPHPGETSAMAGGQPGAYVDFVADARGVRGCTVPS